MSIREDLGVREFVNADSMKTALGGTLMPPSVVEAMRRAAGSFVDMLELQRAVGKRIAHITRNEAAFVSAGASAGLVLSSLACITGPDLKAIAGVMRDGIGSVARRDFIVQCGQRNPYDPAIQLAGGRLVQVGNVLQTFGWELEAAITPTTAGVLYFAGANLGFGSLSFADVVRIAHEASVPVIVDAAAQLPPKANLWSFTEGGADLVVFSGGKELRGPQASGLIVGRQDLIDACALHAAPNQRLARAMKVGKEEMLGLLAAVELYLDQDELEELARCERIVADWTTELSSIPAMAAQRDIPGTDGRPLPRAIVTFAAHTGLTGARVQEALLSGEPSVAVAVAGPNAVYLNPELLRPGEEEAVCDRVKQIVRDEVAASLN
jgi:L-seryl-tRNA(Ser) seleniumtransferase